MTLMRMRSAGLAWRIAPSVQHRASPDDALCNEVNSVRATHAPRWSSGRAPQRIASGLCAPFGFLAAPKASAFPPPPHPPVRWSPAQPVASAAESA